MEDVSNEVWEIAQDLYNDGDLEINRYGEVEGISVMDYEDYNGYYRDCTEDDFDSAKSFLEKLTENAKYYYDRNRYLLLSDNHTIWGIDIPDGAEFNMEDYAIVYEQALANLQEEIGTDVYGLGRSGRHICVDDTFRNLTKLEEYKDAQEKWENWLVEKYEAELRGEDVSLDESLHNGEMKARCLSCGADVIYTKRDINKDIDGEYIECPECHATFDIEPTKKEELFNNDVNLNISTGDISPNLDLGGLGALAGLMASEEEKTCDNKLEEDDINKKVTEDWFGVKEANYIDRGSWSDPLVSYKGYLYNYWDIAEFVSNDMEEDYKEKGETLPADNTKEYDEIFNQYMEMEVENALFDLYPQEIDPNVMQFVEYGTTANNLVDLIKSADSMLKAQTFEGLLVRLEKLKEITNIPEEKIDEAIKTVKEFADSVDYEDSYDEDERYTEVIPVINDILSNLDGLFESKQVTENEKKEIDDIENQLASDKSLKGDERVDLQNDIKYIKDTAEREKRELTEDVSGNIKESLNTGLLPIVDVDMYSINGEIPEDITIEDLDEIIQDKAPMYIKEVLQKVLPSVEIYATGVYHPKQYNFSGDELEFDLTANRDEYEALKEKALNSDEFITFLKDKYKSYDGFVSYLADNIDEFKTQDEWKQVVQVIMFALKDVDLQKIKEQYTEEFLEYVNEKEPDKKEELFNTNINADISTGDISPNIDLDGVGDLLGMTESKLLENNETDLENKFVDMYNNWLDILTSTIKDLKVINHDPKALLDCIKCSDLQMKFMSADNVEISVDVELKLEKSSSQYVEYLNKEVDTPYVLVCHIINSYADDTLPSEKSVVAGIMAVAENNDIQVYSLTKQILLPNIEECAEWLYNWILGEMK